MIHVSYFIKEETGRLFEKNSAGEIIRDAQVIIYPGSGGDNWWDTEQFLKQIDLAIDIHNKVHPDVQALFIFDQSSAHASLPPDALRAWDMNKSNGGKQRKQHDTTIPLSNPHPQFRGLEQKMTTATGEAKGLKQVLEE